MILAAACLAGCFKYTMPGAASDASEDRDAGDPEFVFETDGPDPAADDGGELQPDPDAPADQDALPEEDAPVDGPHEEIPCAADHDPPFISELPDSSATSTTATITWATDEASTSWVDYGFTTEYGASAGSDELTTSHSVRLNALATMTTYAYRVRSRDACGNEIVSGNDTFVTLEGIPLTAPVLTDEPDAVSPTDYAVTLEWSAVATTDGDPTAYSVELDAETDFLSPDFASGWIMTTTWDVTVPTGRTYYWRVRAMDSVDTGITSPWSAVDAFTLSERGAPPAPVVVAQPDYYSNGVDLSVTLVWQAVASPDGDAVEYEAQVAYNYDFTMLHATTGWASALSWTLSVPPSAYLYWRVRARDAVHPSAVSPWSTIDDFWDTWSSGSCPFVYAWNGQKYVYVTDVQGNVLGTRPGSHAADHVRLYDESYVVLEGLVPDAKGALRIKLRETLPEISYVDKVRLVAVDHPAGTDLISSSAENLFRYGGKKAFKLITASSPRLPLDARDASGKDILGAVSKVDGWPAPQDKDTLASYVFDFGKVEHPERARLLIEGWSMFGPLYDTKKSIQPFIEVKDTGGAWVKARSFGSIAGDLKRMAVDISGIFLSGDQRVRVNVGMSPGYRWVIDRVMLDDSAPAATMMRIKDALKAALGFKGRVTYSLGGMKKRIWARDDSLPLNPYAATYGAFTSYGDVRSLLKEADDVIAVMRHGDELALVFPSFEPIDPGMKRTYLLDVFVYYKGVAFSRTVDPLPFKGMSAYPPPAGPLSAVDKARGPLMKRFSKRVVSPPPP